MIQTDNKSSLLPTLDRFTATLFTAAMIIGTGIFGALGSATSIAGSGIILAILVGGFIALFTGISSAQLGINFPKEGGAFIWARELEHKTLSFIAGCAYLGKGILSLAVISLAFASYSAQLFPQVSLSIIAAVTIIFIILFNFLGIRFTSSIIIGLAGLNVLLLAIFSYFAFPHIQIHNLTPIMGNGLINTLAGGAIFFWTWDGFLRTAIMASEVKNPQKTIPFAIIGGIAIASIVYVTVSTATLGVLGPISMGKGDTPLLKAAVLIMGNGGIILILSAAWIATVTEMMGDLLSASRVALAMGKAQEAPAWVSIVHLHSRSPRNAVVIVGSVAIILLLFIPHLRSLLAVASVFTLIWYIIIHFCALQLSPEKRFTSILFSWVGLIGCIGLFFTLPLWAILSAVGVLVLLFIIRYFFNSKLHEE